MTRQCLILGDCAEVMRAMPAASVQTCVTSPPYFGLRDYGMDGQIGLEATPEAYVARMVDVFREVRRVLRDDGTLWLKRWEGWGTALKPAFEPVVVARKPLIGTVAANVLKHGTGAMNIDRCRVETTDDTSGVSGVRSVVPGDSRSSTAAGMYGEAARQVRTGGHALGRWPANVLFTHAPGCGDECAPGCPVAALDAQSGGASRYFTTTEYGDDDLLPGEKPGDPPFFYSPKANRAEREAGCEGLPARSGAEAVDRDEGSAGTQSPSAGAGRTAAKVRNHHPCVKPVSVMRWLVRLVTPKNGVVLDPFAGSGTTSVAAVREGFSFVGIERDPEYFAIATARIEAAANKKH